MNKDDKNYKEKLQDMTELNGDGNRERGRYGEDESKDDKRTGNGDTSNHTNKTDRVL